MVSRRIGLLLVGWLLLWGVAGCREAAPTPTPTAVVVPPTAVLTPLPTPTPDLPAWLLLVYSAPDPLRPAPAVAASDGNAELVIRAGAGPAAELPTWLAANLADRSAERTALLLTGPIPARGPDAAQPDVATLATALRAVLDERPLDLLALDAPLTADLAWLNSVQPFATTAIVQPAALPGAPFLPGLLVALTPDRDPLTLNLPGALTVDLTRLPAATAALDGATAVLAADPALHAPTLAAALAAARRLPAVFDPAVQPPLIDMQRWATELTRAPAWAAVGQELLAALAAALPMADPTLPGLVAPGDLTADPGALPGWQALLAAYRALPAPQPELRVLGAPEPETTIHRAQPAWTGYELRGRRVAELARLALRVEADDRLLLVRYEPIAPPDGAVVWPDGIQSGFDVWDGQAAELGDGAQSDAVVVWPSAEADGRSAVRGFYRPAADPEASIPAVLWFAAEGGPPLALWIAAHGLPQPIDPQPGDQFQLWRHFLSEDGAILPETAATLALDAATLTVRPWPDGDYRLGYRATAADRRYRTATTALTVAQDDAPAGVRAYLDPYLGFQFSYPDAWRPPRYSDGVLTTTDGEGEVVLSVQVTPGRVLTEPLSAETLKADVLAGWSGVSLLYEDAVTTAGEFALRTAYGYFQPSGQRSGIFTTFQRNGVGFVVDLDYPAAREAELIAAVNDLLAGWRFQPVGLGFAPEQWAALAGGEAAPFIPDNYVLEELENGWRRYRSTQARSTFFALRSDPLSGVDAAAVSAAWVALLGQGVSDLTMREPVGLPLAGLAWTAVEFGYTAADGAPISGLLLTSVLDQERVLWVEAPTERWETFREEMLVLGAAELSRK